eukprot:m51a1_g2254 hypothetical protein (365) ;mRNA; f:310354-311734
MSGVDGGPPPDGKAGGRDLTFVTAPSLIGADDPESDYAEARRDLQDHIDQTDHMRSDLQQWVQGLKDNPSVMMPTVIVPRTRAFDELMSMIDSETISDPMSFWSMCLMDQKFMAEAAQDERIIKGLIEIRRLDLVLKSKRRQVHDILAHRRELEASAGPDGRPETEEERRRRIAAIADPDERRLEEVLSRSEAPVAAAASAASAAATRAAQQVAVVPTVYTVPAPLSQKLRDIEAKLKAFDDAPDVLLPAASVIRHGAPHLQSRAPPEAFRGKLADLDKRLSMLQVSDSVAQQTGRTEMERLKEICRSEAEARYRTAHSADVVAEAVPPPVRAPSYLPPRIAAPAAAFDGDAVAVAAEAKEKRR